MYTMDIEYVEPGDPRPGTHPRYQVFEEVQPDTTTTPLADGENQAPATTYWESPDYPAEETTPDETLVEEAPEFTQPDPVFSDQSVPDPSFSDPSFSEEPPPDTNGGEDPLNQ